MSFRRLMILRSLVAALLAINLGGCIDSLSSNQVVVFGEGPQSEVTETQSAVLVVKNDEMVSESIAFLKEAISDGLKELPTELAPARVMTGPVQQSGRSLQFRIQSNWSNIYDYLASSETTWIIRESPEGNHWELLSPAGFHSSSNRGESLGAIAFIDAEIVSALSITAPGPVSQCSGQKTGVNSCLWQNIEGHDVSLVFHSNNFTAEDLSEPQVDRLLKQLKSDSDDSSDKKKNARLRRQAAEALKLLGESNDRVVTALQKAFAIETDTDARFAMSQALRTLD